MDKIRLQILGLSSSQSQSDSFALILEEEEGNRRLPIIIGRFEAQAIAIEIEKVTSTRPMTHDLFKSLATQFQFKLNEIIISDLREGIFYAEMIYIDEREGKKVIVDARPSDAIAIGLRFDAPIYTTEAIMREAGITTTNTSDENAPLQQEEGAKEPKKKKAKKKVSLETMSVTELEAEMEKAVADEDYEKAAKIRDEMNKRN
ncbi:bifunctional nuclease family protein [Bernardetia sp.]|uniref:bifunctional nuclease family protein n=1 Tax=Bernardetia sp. TaxID=1937974 RepID=UPI0025B87330|nr:bifunctional nuclease family protein [Bernardetia sp.]